MKFKKFQPRRTIYIEKWIFWQIFSVFFRLLWVSIRTNQCVIKSVTMDIWAKCLKRDSKKSPKQYELHDNDDLLMDFEIGGVIKKYDICLVVQIL